MAMLRRVMFVGFMVALVSTAPACGKGNELTPAEALAEADRKEAERKAQDDAAQKKLLDEARSGKGEGDGELAYPWKLDDLKRDLTMGTVITYKVTGTDAKGKKVDDTLRVVIKGGDDKEIKVASDFDSEKGKPTFGQAKAVGWSKFSPTFYVERPTETLTGKQKVNVPAGEYECVMAEVSGFFGEQLTVCMIPDKPGVYAKVVDHGNKNEEKDKTELVYELVEIGKA